MSRSDPGNPLISRALRSNPQAFHCTFPPGQSGSAAAQGSSVKFLEMPRLQALRNNDQLHQNSGAARADPTPEIH